MADYESIKILPLQFRVLFSLALFAGLRKGELLALQWTGIDFTSDSLSITKAASMVGGKQIAKAPKTKSGIREINIPHFLALRLKELKADQLPLIPFHGLRHTSATVLIANHADIKTVQNRLGHAEASTTMNIYAHALQETDRKAADTLQNVLRKQS